MAALRGIAQGKAARRDERSSGKEHEDGDVIFSGVRRKSGLSPGISEMQIPRRPDENHRDPLGMTMKKPKIASGAVRRATAGKLRASRTKSGAVINDDL